MDVKDFKLLSGAALMLTGVSLVGGFLHAEDPRLLHGAGLALLIMTGFFLMLAGMEEG